MSNPNQAEIDRLLQEGLDHYGVDEVGNALRFWREALALDPDNAEAIDYIETADRREHHRGQKDIAVGSVAQGAIALARELIASAQLDEALDLLRSTADPSQLSLELEATVELVRAVLLQNYRQSMGDGSLVPEVAADMNQISKLNLTPGAGFLLSLVDGEMTLDSLVAVSGMDSFEALRTTKSLIDAGVVRMQLCD